MPPMHIYLHPLPLLKDCYLLISDGQFCMARSRDQTWLNQERSCRQRATMMGTLTTLIALIPSSTYNFPSECQQWWFQTCPVTLGLPNLGKLYHIFGVSNFFFTSRNPPLPTTSGPGFPFRHPLVDIPPSPIWTLVSWMAQGPTSLRYESVKALECMGPI